MNLESCFCFRMYLPGFRLTEKVEQNFQKLDIGQNQRNSGYFQLFSVCPIITQGSTRLTMPVAFIAFFSLLSFSYAIVCKEWGIMRKKLCVWKYRIIFSYG
ncbi:MAG: hypothetical protein IJZ39_11170, partial [Oscillospiraceae bacterium]|nr:hypothetical protein [Oscillospiraceae bacterium]